MEEEDDDDEEEDNEFEEDDDDEEGEEGEEEILFRLVLIGRCSFVLYYTWLCLRVKGEYRQAMQLIGRYLWVCLGYFCLWFYFAYCYVRGSFV